MKMIEKEVELAHMHRRKEKQEDLRLPSASIDESKGRCQKRGKEKDII